MLINAVRRALSRPHAEAAFACSNLLSRPPPLSIHTILRRQGVLSTRPFHSSTARARSVHSPENVNVEHSEWLTDSSGFGKEAKAGNHLDSDDLEQIAEGKGVSFREISLYGSNAHASQGNSPQRPPTSSSSSCHWRASSTSWVCQRRRAPKRLHPSLPSSYFTPHNRCHTYLDCCLPPCPTTPATSLSAVTHAAAKHNNGPTRPTLPTSCARLHVPTRSLCA